jgi:hypothetical protein
MTRYVLFVASTLSYIISTEHKYWYYRTSHIENAKAGPVGL